MKKGFTLLEFLLYSAVAGVVLITAGIFAIDMLQASAKTSAMQELSDTGRFVAEKIRYEVRNAEAIAAPAPGMAAAELTLEVPDAWNTVTIRKNGARLELQRGSSPAVMLTADTLEIVDFSVLNTASSLAEPGAVRAILIVSSAQNYTRTFYITANVYAQP